jgi:non-specific serine/threonine protein kinase
VTAVASLADRLLRESRGVQLLVTSREALRVAGEKIMRVDPLPESDAVLLFAERSVAVQPSFRLTSENAESVTQICRRVEGIPLAIELAAGRARMMSPAEILARLQDSFRVLAGGSRTADPRHQTILAAVDWSYRLLNEEEKQLFRQLSVFSGGFTLEAAEAVCSVEGVESVLDLVGQLLDKSLITSHETERGGTRYFLLEAVREYGHARLVEESELERIQKRHTTFYVEFAETARRSLKGPDRMGSLRRIGDDIDNLRSVFDTPSVDAETALQLAASMEAFWEFRGDFTEGRARLESVLQAPTARSLTRARALLGLAPLAGAQGDERAAAQYCRQALELFRELGDAEGEASSLQRLGQSQVQLEEFGEARSSLREALEIATRHGFDAIRSVCFWRLGMVDLFAGDMPAAHDHIVASLALSRELSDEEMIALSLLMLGNIALWQGRLTEARANLGEGLATWRRDGNTRAIANFMESLAAAAAADGQKERALKLGGAAEALRERGAVVPSSPFHREIRSRLEALRQDPQGRDAWISGSQMSRDEAIDYALSSTD